MRLHFSAEKNRKLLPVLLGFLILGNLAAAQDLGRLTLDHQVHELAHQAIIE
ncbi:MAG TPA: hypothetical protein VFE61_23035 [Candidatus Sulfotelmatobacter sp.]|nr:hypothetical protein [Candidatus Sulfotelmatobacter sp.]